MADTVFVDRDDGGEGSEAFLGAGGGGRSHVGGVLLEARMKRRRQ